MLAAKASPHRGEKRPPWDQIQERTRGQDRQPSNPLAEPPQEFRATVVDQGKDSLTVCRHVIEVAGPIEVCRAGSARNRNAAASADLQCGRIVGLPRIALRGETETIVSELLDLAEWQASGSQILSRRRTGAQMQDDLPGSGRIRLQPQLYRFQSRLRCDESLAEAAPGGEGHAEGFVGPFLTRSGPDAASG